MQSPSTLCPNVATVRHIQQETADVYTIELHCHTPFTYLPGQYVFVCINGDDSVIRAYTLSSSPLSSPNDTGSHLRLTVRHIENGVGSTWLTQQVKIGDTLWLSDAQGEFTCSDITHPRYLMLAAGCGITPIMSMVRWLLHNNKAEHIAVLYHVKTLADVIFAQEWDTLAKHYTNLNLLIITTQEASYLPLSGRLSDEQLRRYVPDMTDRTVMCCGPDVYMQHSKALCLDLGVSEHHFHQEYFYQANNACSDDEESSLLANIRINKHSINFTVPVGTNLLYALEQHDVPIFAACRSGVCGSCKIKIDSGDYETQSQLTLTEDEIQSGYVLACSCQIKGHLTVD